MESWISDLVDDIMKKPLFTSNGKRLGEAFVSSENEKLLSLYYNPVRVPLHEEPPTFWEDLGFESGARRHEWRRGAWTIEWLGTPDRPYFWRIDNKLKDYSIPQMLFLGIRSGSELKWLMNAIGI